MARSIRISRTVLDYLSGTEAWQDVKFAPFGTTETRHTNKETFTLFLRMQDERARKDGSISLRLSLFEVNTLIDYVQAMRTAASDNLHDPLYLGEYNAATTLLKHLRDYRWDVQ